MLDDRRQELNQLRQRLAEIESKRRQVLQRMLEVEAGLSRSGNDDSISGITNFSSTKDKIKLFRSLFRGRDDVYARRFESAKTGKCGYQPVCKNEWARGICGKPNVKCSACNNREYLPLTDQIIEWHLRGEDYYYNAG